MLALTLWQPWAWAILHLPPELAKPVENRDWLDARVHSVLGKRIALHGGKRWDDRAAATMHRATGRSLVTLQHDRASIYGFETLSEVAACGILGTVRLPGVVEERRGRLELVAGDWGETSRERCVPWFVGRYGFLVDQRRVLEQPIVCKGFQKFWRVPDEIAARLA